MGKRIKKSEVYDNRFYRIPKTFFVFEQYKKMSLYAKMLYGFLDDRRELSLKNNWVDKYDNIYLIFTRESVRELLCLSDKTVTKAFKELKEKGLIEEVRQGLNKPNIIYVCHLDTENVEESRNRNLYESEVGQNTNQKSEILRGNDTDFNDPDISEPDNIQGANEISTPYPSSSLPYIDYVCEMLRGKRIQRKESILDTIIYYLRKYSICTGKEHNRYSEKKTKEIILRLEDIFINGLDSEDHGTIDIDEEIMQDLIDQHFRNTYPNANHKLMAFLPNDVLVLRYYEIM